MQVQLPFGRGSFAHLVVIYNGVVENSLDSLRPDWKARGSKRDILNIISALINSFIYTLFS